jgi:hypothetical protein
VDRACRFKAPARVTTPGFCRYRPSRIRLLFEKGRIGRLQMPRIELGRYDDELRRGGCVSGARRGLAAADAGGRGFLSCVSRLRADESAESYEAESDDENFSHFQFPDSFLLLITFFEASIRQRFVRR